MITTYIENVYENQFWDMSAVLQLLAMQGHQENRIRWHAIVSGSDFNIMLASISYAQRQIGRFN